MKTKFLTASFFVLVLIVFGKLLSFLRDIAISYFYGSSNETDAFFAANSIPSIIFAAVVSSYIALLIPTYKRIQENSGIPYADVFVSRLLNFFVISSILLSIISFISIDYLVYFVAPGFDSETFNLTKTLAKILILSFPFSGATLILATISNAHNKFYATHLIPIFSSLFVVLSIWLFSNKYGIIVLAISGVVAFVFQLLIQIFISKNHFTYTFKTKLWDLEIKKMSWLVLPIFLGFSIDQINLLVNTIISSNLQEGSLSVLNYAQRLQATITGTITTAILTVLYPYMSTLNAQNNMIKLSNVVLLSVRFLFLAMLPVTIFIVFYSGDIVKIVYSRGNFSDNAVDMTTNVFVFYAINVFFISTREFLLRIFYIKGKTKLPFWISVFSLIVNALLSLYLIRYYGVSGLSLANLIATLISCLVLFITFNHQTSILLSFKNIFEFYLSIAFPILFSSIIMYVFKSYIDVEGSIFIFLLNFILYLFLFYFFLLLFKQKEAIVIKFEMKKVLKNILK